MESEIFPSSLTNEIKGHLLGDETWNITACVCDFNIWVILPYIVAGKAYSILFLFRPFAILTYLLKIHWLWDSSYEDISSIWANFFFTWLAAHTFTLWGNSVRTNLGEPYIEKDSSSWFVFSKTLYISSEDSLVISSMLSIVLLFSSTVVKYFFLFLLIHHPFIVHVEYLFLLL